MTDEADVDSRVGLCGRCRHTERVVSVRGAIFYLCKRSFTDQGFPKYPPLPVVTCVGYERRDESERT